MVIDKIKRKIEEMNLKSKIYVSKIILAAIATLGCFVLTLTQIENSQAWGVFLGWLLVVVHFFIVWKVVKVDLNEIGGKGKILMEGFGTYIFIWLLLWTTIHTIWWILNYGVPIFYP